MINNLLLFIGGVGFGVAIGVGVFGHFLKKKLKKQEKERLLNESKESDEENSRHDA